MVEWIKIALGMEVGLGPGHIVLDGDPALLPKKGAEPPPNFRPIFIVGKRLDASRCHLVWRYASVRRLCVRWGPSLPPQKGGAPLEFSAHVCCGKTAAWIKMPLGTEVDLGLRDIVLDGDPASPPAKEHTARPPIFAQCPLWPNGWMD